MGKAPSLTALCLEAVRDELFRGDDLLPAIYEFPSYVFEILVRGSPPLILHKLHMSMNSGDRNDDNYDDYTRGNGRKRGRSSNFDKAWRDLFELRWPKLVNEIQSVDWHQIYWETHLQRCLDEAAEIAFLPSFDGFLGEIKISDATLKHIGGHMKSCPRAWSKLSYHLQEFGQYARRLRLQNILCGPETPHLLRKSKLQNLVLEWIRSEEQIGGLCKLLSQNRESLSSLEFSHCKLSSSSINEICGSLTTKSVPTHGIQKFSICTSRFHETNPVSLPPGLVSFLSSGSWLAKIGLGAAYRAQSMTGLTNLASVISSLCSLKLSDNYLGQNFANMVFNTLCNVSSAVSILDLSENNIKGWLCNFSQRSSTNHPTFPEFGKSLQSLRVLNIRGNDLHVNDAIGLTYTLVHMPNLEVLDISDNPIGIDGIRSLLPYFVEASDKGSPFAELYVENCDLSDFGVIDLVNSLATLRRPLKSLSIANNVVDSKAASALGKFLSTSIQVLNISGIGLGPDGFRTLQQSLAEELKLVEINISKNRGGIAAANFLAEILSRAPGLVSVNAAHNFMPVESTRIICSALKTPRGNLESLDLRGNNLVAGTADGVDELQSIRPPVLYTRFPIPDAPYDVDP